MRRRAGSGKDLAPMDLRSVLRSSDSTASTTIDGSSAKAEWIIMMAFTSSISPKHHPLLPRVSMIIDSESVELSSILARLYVRVRVCHCKIQIGVGIDDSISRYFYTFGLGFTMRSDGCFYLLFMLFLGWAEQRNDSMS